MGKQLSEWRCAYCGSGGKRTKEHLWPRSLHGRLLAANSEKESLFWLRRINAEIGAEPTIRDVCANCNNEDLSILDAYICRLFDDYFSNIPNRYDKVRFTYDYHLLKRWLLKMCFNSARVNSSKDLFVYPPLLPYILGNSNTSGKSVQLYLQLSYPSLIPPERLAHPDLVDAPPVWKPADHRVGFLWLDVPGAGRKLLRAVHLRSYSFFLAFFDPSAGGALARTFAEVFRSRMPNAVLLTASRTWVDLVCNGANAWQLYDGGRENAIV